MATTPNPKPLEPAVGVSVTVCLSVGSVVSCVVVVEGPVRVDAVSRVTTHQIGQSRYTVGSRTDTRTVASS